MRVGGGKAEVGSDWSGWAARGGLDALGLIEVLGPRLRGDDVLVAAGSRPRTPG